MPDYQRNIAIAWTSEFEDYDQWLTAAVTECAQALPGCMYFIVGSNGIMDDQTTADYILQSTVRMDKYRGWVIDSLDAVQKIRTLGQCHYGPHYDTIIVLTKQKISRRIIDSPYEYCLRSAALISLEICETIDDIENVATLFLKHVLGHIYMDETLHAHCSHEHCTMTGLYDRRRILELADCEKEFGFDTYCDDCKDEIRHGELWSDEPSLVIHT